jgi:tRNA(Arg) A34 adenosine deaminase TadA
MNWAEADVNRMRQALAEAGRNENEVPVGAVVVAGGRIVGRGRNRVIAHNDPSAHAEIIALREAGRAIGNYRLNDCSLYVTLEPCAMCMGAVLESRIRRLVFGAYDDKAGAAGSVLDLAALQPGGGRLEVNGGVLEAESVALLQAFFGARR